ncbi:MAG: HAD family hydrolase, partial [Chloroflexi bacterium]|nr:HAD family hydrolase [Chloroflexota bacterium]
KAARHDYLNDLALGEVNGIVQPQTRQDIMRLYKQLLQRMGYARIGRDLTYRIYKSYGKLPTTMYDDVLPTLQALQKQPLTLGILSNHSASTRTIMESMVNGFIKPQHIIISEELGVHKPSKTIFRHAAARLHTPPENCLYVGDNLYVDAIGSVIKGKYGLGVWVDRHNQQVAQDFPEQVVRITYLQQLIDFLNG